ncbi:LuxR C-terminal-related transcriptional regulator [Brevundimonas sp. NPDC090276]|uniref:LuxR C-terminal-related transcriptional regulator n=1 Tax=Brevundimonas sp. NPDC090276 TaxID=3363956 RepID=UPI00383BBE39
MVADDQPLYRAGLVATLRNHLAAEEVREEADYGGVLKGLASAPDTQLLSVDLELPGMGNLDGIRRLRRHHPDLKVIVVAWPPARRSVFNALSAGAHGFVSKRCAPAEMAASFKSVLEGNIYIPSTVCDLQPEPRADIHDDAHLLTCRQRQVLTLLTAGKSNKEIGRALMISESTVKVHLTAAFRQLGVHSRMAAAAALQQHTPSSQLDLPGLSALG